MFLSQRMKKLDIVILKKDMELVSKEVIRFGEFQVIDIVGEKAKAFMLEKNYNTQKINYLLEYERRVNYLKNAFESNELMKQVEEFLKAPPAPEDMAKYTPKPPTEIEKMIKEIEAELNHYNLEVERVKRRKSDVEIKIQKAVFFSDMEVEWVKFKDLKHVYLSFGIIPNTSFQGFTSAVSSIPSVAFKVIGTQAEDTIVFIAASNSVKDKMDSILKNVYFRDYGTPAELGEASRSKIMKYSFDLSSVLDDEIWLDKRFVKLSQKYMPILEELKKSLKYHIGMAKLEEEMASTKNILLFSGWVPEKSVEKIKEIIAEKTANRCEFAVSSAKEALATEGIMPPTRLSNPRFLRPFEILVNTFGVPAYNEIDPTPIAALAYVVMYGAMFGDVGHGLVIAAIGLLIMLVKKFRSFANFGAILLGIGIFSTFFGFLYGEVFGRERIFDPLWESPSHHIMDILFVAVVMGVVMISLGMILNIINSLMERNPIKMLCSSKGLAGIAFYWSLLYVVYGVIYNSPAPSWIWAIPSVSVILIMFEKHLEKLFSHEHHEKPSLINGFFEVFEAVLSLLSNTISFMRVGAFALNHSALMGVVFLMAGDPATVNPVLYWFVILLGNIFVIVFEGFIVGIQALRLEYYEFFTKFFRASGKKFNGIGIYKDSEG